MYHLIKSGCFLTLTEIGSKRFVLIDNVSNGIHCIFSIIGKCKIPIHFLRRVQHFMIIPRSLTDIPHLWRNSIRQSPCQRIKSVHIGRSISKGPDCFRKIYIIRIVILRTVKITFQPGTSPVFTISINTSRLKSGRIVRYRGTNDIFRQTIHRFRS